MEQLGSLQIIYMNEIRIFLRLKEKNALKVKPKLESNTFWFEEEKNPF